MARDNSVVLDTEDENPAWLSSFLRRFPSRAAYRGGAKDSTTVRNARSSRMSTLLLTSADGGVFLTAVSRYTFPGGR